MIRISSVGTIKMKITFDIEDLKQFYLSQPTDKDEWYGPERDLNTSGVMLFLEYLDKKKAVAEMEDFMYKTKFPD